MSVSLDEYLTRHQAVAQLQKSTGLSERGFLALAVLKQHRGMTVGEIRRVLGIKGPSMSRLIRRLDRRILCLIHDADRRKVDVSITPKGEEDFARFAAILSNGHGARKGGAA